MFALSNFRKKIIIADQYCYLRKYEDTGEFIGP